MTSPMRLIACAGISIIAVVAVIIVPLLAISPYEHKLACQFQVGLYDLVGLGGLHTWPSEADDQYTGVVRIWDKSGRLRKECSYQLGARHGVWREYSDDGTLKSVCEYKDGRPWNGVCRVWEWKSFIAEFRDGKPYNGCVWERDANGYSIDVCFIDGKQVPIEDFMAHHKIDDDGKDTLVLRDIFTTSHWQMRSASLTAGAQAP